MLAGDRGLAHSVLSASLNLGLVDPLEVADAPSRPTAAGTRRSNPSRASSARSWAGGTASGTCTGTSGAATGTATPWTPGAVPEWLAELDAGAVDAACLRDVLADVRERGWVHHIPRLMVLGN